MKVCVAVTLSQAGQKQAALGEKNAAEKQVREYDTPATAELLEIASIDRDGLARINASPYIYGLMPTTADSMYLLWDELPEIAEVLVALKSYQAAKQIYDAKKEQEEKDKREASRKRYEEQTDYANQLLVAYNDGGLSAMRKVATASSTGYRWGLNELPSSIVSPIQQALKAEADDREKAKQAEETAREAVALKEKVDWASEYGSERLRLAIEGGYDAQRQYTTERAQMELSLGSVLDFNSRGHWGERSCPTLEAITLEQELKKKGFVAKTVWGYLCDCDTDYTCKCESHEIVIVENYLNVCDVVVANF